MTIRLSGRALVVPYLPVETDDRAQLEAEFGQAGMLVWPSPERPDELTVPLGNRVIVNARNAAAHQPVVVELLDAPCERNQPPLSSHS